MTAALPVTLIMDGAGSMPASSLACGTARPAATAGTRRHNWCVNAIIKGLT
jgi:hypothetical protein